VLAAVLGGLAADTDAFVASLADRLSRGLPTRTRVERAGLLGRGSVRRIVIDLGERRFQLDHDRGRLETVVATAVRRVVIRTESVPVDVWLAALGQDLAAEADANVAVRAALEAAFSS
jgi:hypothetical protein